MKTANDNFLFEKDHDAAERRLTNGQGAYQHLLSEYAGQLAA